MIRKGRERSRFFCPGLYDGIVSSHLAHNFSYHGFDGEIIIRFGSGSGHCVELNDRCKKERKVFDLLSTLGEFDFMRIDCILFLKDFPCSIVFDRASLVAVF